MMTNKSIEFIIDVINNEHDEIETEISQVRYAENLLKLMENTHV